MMSKELADIIALFVAITASFVLSSLALFTLYNMFPNSPKIFIIGVTLTTIVISYAYGAIVQGYVEKKFTKGKKK